MKTYTKEAVSSTIAEVETVLEAMLKSEVESLKAKQKLAKGEMDEGGGDLDKGAMCKDEGKPDESASSPAPDASPAPGPDQSAPASPAPSPDASAAPGADPAAGGAPTSPQDLASAYCELSPEERGMHLQALQQAMAQCGDGQGSPAGAPGGAPGMGASPAPASPAPAPGMGAPMPGEGSAPVSPGSEMALKSEMASMKVHTQELQKNFDLVSQALVAMIKVPQRKAVTGKDVIPAQAPAVDVSKLSKAELTKKLTKVASDPTLTKSDRDLIKKFYKQEVKVEDLTHLLQK